MHTPGSVYPRDDAARAGFRRWAEYDVASPGYSEQVFFHHPHCDDQGVALTALLHPDFGLAVEWDTSPLPYLTQWKNTRQGIYVCGIEPANCIPEGQNTARSKGRLEILQPDQARVFRCSIRVLDGTQAVQSCRDHIDYLRNQGQSVKGCHLQDYATQ
jgi:hypothetical protein